MIYKTEDIEWIRSKIPGGSKEIKLLFDPEIHGWGKADFHKICDGHPNPTITFIKSKAYKIFGGFTFNKWSSIEEYQTGQGTFIFSLDQKKIYEQLTDYSIFCSPRCGQSFGESNLLVGLNCDRMNREERSDCNTEDYVYWDHYQIPTD